MFEWQDYKVNVPSGTSGEWKIDRFKIDAEKDMWWMLSASLDGRCTPAGEYTRLKRGNVVVMSDTRAEVMDHSAVLKKRRLKGRALILGLGLGMVLDGLLTNNRKLSVTVVDASQDVINLVGKHYKEKFGDRLEIIHTDAYEWVSPHEEYELLWCDIWDTISADNIPLMRKLEARYNAKWKGSWAKERCVEMLAEERRRQRERQEFFGC